MKGPEKRRRVWFGNSPGPRKGRVRKLSKEESQVQ